MGIYVEIATFELARGEKNGKRSIIQNVPTSSLRAEST